jgi:NAD-dependent deacetylase
MLEQAAIIIAQADQLIIIGTSLRVYPAAALIHEVSKHSAVYLIDPNANEMNLPFGVQAIKETAVGGMSLLYKQLTS